MMMQVSGGIYLPESFRLHDAHPRYADNILLMFVGWEGVVFAHYLLIGFWYEKDSAANAGKKPLL